MNPMKKLLNDWHDNDIVYCVWKGVNKFEQVLEGKEDLDILLHNESSNRAVELLYDNGFVQFNNIVSKSDVGTLDFLKLMDSGVWLHIHVHFSIVFGSSVVRHYRLPIEKEIFETKFWDDKYEVWTIQPTYDLLLFLVRHLLRKNPFNIYVDFENDLRELQKYYKNADVIINSASASKLNEHFSVLTLMLDKYPNLEMKDVKSIRSKIKSFYKMQKEQTDTYYFISYFSNYILNSGTIILRRLGLPVYKKRLIKSGVLIAFIGIDGSGKSSAIERLQRNLSSQISTFSISMGSGVSGASWYRKLVFKLFGTKAKFKGHIQAREDRLNKLKSNLPWYYALWMMICLYDKRRELHKGITKKSRGAVILSDRWLQEEIQGFVDSPRVAFDKNGNWINKKLYKLEREVYRMSKYNKPDYIVRFDVNAENSVLRKPNDLSFQQAEEAAKKIKNIIWIGSTVKEINANNEISVVDRDLNKLIQSILQDF